MATFIAYLPLTKAELETALVETIEGVGEFFEQNPDRDDCEAQVWQGKEISLRRDTYEQQLRTLAAETRTKDD